MTTTKALDNLRIEFRRQQQHAIRMRRAAQALLDDTDPLDWTQAEHRERIARTRDRWESVAQTWAHAKITVSELEAQATCPQPQPQDEQAP
jgi:hypothetical protein